MTGTKSNKQRAAELKAKRAARTVKLAKRETADALAYKEAIGPPLGSVPVSRDKLNFEDYYFGYNGELFPQPSFLARGYYLDKPFVCKSCGKDEVWTATQQKWWYEIAKGSAVTTARFCRPCRRKERERAADHKKRSDEGRKRTFALKASGK